MSTLADRNAAQSAKCVNHVGGPPSIVLSVTDINMKPPSHGVSTTGNATGILRAPALAMMHLLV